MKGEGSEGLRGLGAWDMQGCSYGSTAHHTAATYMAEAGCPAENTRSKGGMADGTRAFAICGEVRSMRNPPCAWRMEA